MSISPAEVKWDSDPIDTGKVQWDEAPAFAPESSLARTAGLTGRAALSAITSPVHVGASVLNKAINALAGRQVLDPNPSANFEAALTNLGLPEPTSGTEKFSQSVAQSAPAFAIPTSLPAQVLGNAAIGAAQARPGEEAREATLGAAAGGAGHYAPSVLKKALQFVGKVSSTALGTTTGAGAEAIEQAAKAGRAGGAADEAFTANMRGNANPATVVEQARQGVKNMWQQMYDSYATAKGGWAGDKTPLDFRPIGQAYNDAAQKFSFKGVPQPGAAEVQPQVRAAMEDWLKRAQSDPSFLTVEGLDALKRHLNDLMPSYENRTGRAFVSEVVDGVKSSIIKQRPDYKDAMQNYWQSTSQLDEIEKSLSLGDKATIDTTLRKLQSLMRNNVATNYGQRLKSAASIATQGGEDILPAVAGQALNSPAPRGIQAAVATPAALITGSLSNPYAAVAQLLASSPRLVGETARAAGKATRPFDDVTAQALIEALRRTGPTMGRK
jgi:hypothetical protein